VAITVRDSHDAGTLVAWWIGAALLLGLTVPVLYVYFAGAFPPGFSWIFHSLVAFTALAGPIVLYKAGRATLEYFRFGRLLLRIPDQGPVVGGELAAVLALPTAVERVSAELVCIELGRPHDSSKVLARTVGGARVGALQGRVLWSSGAQTFPSGATIHIAIPASLPASDMPDPGEAVRGRIYHAWELRVDAALPGLDLSRTFEIEVSAGQK